MSHPDMTELFRRDPLELTDDDITAIIEEYRKRRAKFKALPTGTTPKKLTASEETAKKKIGDLGGFTL